MNVYEILQLFLRIQKNSNMALSNGDAAILTLALVLSLDRDKKSILHALYPDPDVIKVDKDGNVTPEGAQVLRESGQPIPPTPSHGDPREPQPS